MSRNNAVITTVRRAIFTTPAHDEIMLSYPHEGDEGHQDNGKQQTVFYSPDRYFTKQYEHSKKTYPDPEPFTDGKFKR